MSSITPSSPKKRKTSKKGDPAGSVIPGKGDGTTGAPTTGRVTILVGSKRVELVAAKLDPATIQDIVDQLVGDAHLTTPIELGVFGFADWSPSDRERFWALFAGLRNREVREVVVRADGTKFGRPVDWAASGLLTPAGDTDLQCRALGVAAEILTHAYMPADREVYLEEIAGKLRERKLTTRYCDAVRCNIRQRFRGHGRRNECGEVPQRDGGGGAYAQAQLFLADRYLLKSGPDFDTAEENGLRTVSDTSRYSLRYYGEAFYRWKGSVWVEASPEDLKLELTSYLQGVSPDRTGVKHVGDVFMNVKALCAVRADGTPPLPFHLANPGRRMLAFENGLLDLTALARGEKPTLLPHDPDWFSTSALSYRFEPKARCPKFWAFLVQIFNVEPKKFKSLTSGDNRARVVQEWLGYSLIPDNPLQKFTIFTGPGGNGKGIVFDVLARMLGPELVSSVPLDAMGTDFGTEPLLGKMVNLAGDMNEIDAPMEGTLKMWTGQDRVTVNRKYKTALQVEAGIKFIYGCNQLPWFKDKTNGLWRRLIVVPFTYTPPTENDIDTMLREKLQGELSGIMNFALRGLARLLKNRRFTACDLCAAAAKKHRTECSPVREFITNHFTLAAEYDGPKDGKKWWTTAKEVAQLVKDYDVKFGDRKLSAHIVARELGAMPGVTPRRPSTVTGRTEFGTLFYGVCSGEPRSVMPDEISDVEAKTGLEGLASPPNSAGSDE